MPINKVSAFTGDTEFLYTAATLIFDKANDATTVLKDLSESSEYAGKFTENTEKSSDTQKVLESKVEDCFVGINRHIKKIIPNTSINIKISIKTVIYMKYEIMDDKKRLSESLKQVGEKEGISWRFNDEQMLVTFYIKDATVNGCLSKLANVFAYAVKTYGTNDKFSRPLIQKSDSVFAKLVKQVLAEKAKKLKARPEKESKFKNMYQVDFLTKTKEFIEAFGPDFFEASEDLYALLLEYGDKLTYEVERRNSFFVKFRETENKAEKTLNAVNFEDIVEDAETEFKFRSDVSEKEKLEAKLRNQVAALTHWCGVSSWLGDIVDNADDRISNVIKKYLLMFDRALSEVENKSLPNPVTDVLGDIKKDIETKKNNTIDKIDKLGPAPANSKIANLPEETKAVVSDKFGKEASKLGTVITFCDNLIAEYRRAGHKDLTKVLKSPAANFSVDVVPEDYYVGNFLKKQEESKGGAAKKSDADKAADKVWKTFVKNDSETAKAKLIEDQTQVSKHIPDTGHLDMDDNVRFDLQSKPQVDFTQTPVNAFVDELEKIAGDIVGPDPNLIGGSLKDLYTLINMLPSADKYKRADVDQENLGYVVNLLAKTKLPENMYKDDPKKRSKFKKFISTLIPENYKSSHIKETDKQIHDQYSSVKTGQDTAERWLDALGDNAGAERDSLPIVVQDSLLKEVGSYSGDSLTSDQVNELVIKLKDYAAIIDDIKKTKDKDKLKQISGTSTFNPARIDKWEKNVDELILSISGRGSLFKGTLIKCFLMPDNAAYFVGKDSAENPSTDAKKLLNDLVADEKLITPDTSYADQITILTDIFNRIDDFLNKLSSRADVGGRKLLLKYRGDLARKYNDTIEHSTELQNILLNF